MQLSDKEIAILELLGAGQTNRQIGLSLGLSKFTIEWYKIRIINKLDAENSYNALLKAVRLGIIH